MVVVVTRKHDCMFRPESQRILGDKAAPPA